MEFSEDKTSDLPLITGYGEGGFRVLRKHHTGSLLITPAAWFEWKVAKPSEITKKSLKPLLDHEYEPEFLLVGVGREVENQAIFSRKLSKTLGLPCEVMTTGAAVRTYNVLALEERLVAAAILAVQG